MNDLLAKLDQHEATRAGAPTGTADLAFYLEIAEEALRRLQAGRVTPIEDEPLGEIIAELDQVDAIPADVAAEVKAMWETWEA